MFGYLCYGAMGIALIAGGNMMLGCAALVGASVWLMTSSVDADE